MPGLDLLGNGKQDASLALPLPFCVHALAECTEVNYLSLTFCLESPQIPGEASAVKTGCPPGKDNYP